MTIEELQRKIAMWQRDPDRTEIEVQVRVNGDRETVRVVEIKPLDSRHIALVTEPFTLEQNAA